MVPPTTIAAAGNTLIWPWVMPHDQDADMAAYLAEAEDGLCSEPSASDNDPYELRTILAEPDEVGMMVDLKPNPSLLPRPRSVVPSESRHGVDTPKEDDSKQTLLDESFSDNGSDELDIPDKQFDEMARNTIEPMWGRPAVRRGTHSLFAPTLGLRLSPYFKGRPMLNSAAGTPVHLSRAIPLFPESLQQQGEPGRPNRLKSRFPAPVRNGMQGRVYGPSVEEILRIEKERGRWAKERVERERAWWQRGRKF